MNRVLKTVVAGLVLSTVSSPALALKSMPYQYLYSYTFYSDASMTTVVGYGSDVCYEFEGNVWVVTPQFPTPYYTSEQGHECRPGGPL